MPFDNSEKENAWRYTVTAGRRMRRGYSTGSCAAAAARAATAMLFSGQAVDIVSIDTPSGVKLTLLVENVLLGAGSAECSVRKDAGDDPDITNGMDLFARAVLSAQPGVTIRAGRGVGVVTKPGLQVAVGRPAINQRCRPEKG